MESRTETDDDAAESRTLRWQDAASLIVGIVVGAAIFKVPPLVFSCVSGPMAGLLVWLVGGLVAFCGALCYAELATSLPKSGGDYVYLTRAYAPIVGFLFGWAHLTGILTGSIGSMAYIFAEYANALFEFSADKIVLTALVAVIGLTLLNIGGVVFGKTAQNVLTIAKVLGLVGIAVCGLIGGDGLLTAAEPVDGQTANFGLAFVLILYAYGGWNDAAFVAAEVREPARNIPKALLGGVGLVTLIYLLINAAYINGLGWTGIQQSSAPAADVLKPKFGSTGHAVMCVLIMISTLGALNGLILTGSRVHASLGADHRLFAWLAWQPQDHKAPLASLIVQGVISILLVLSVGTQAGKNTVDQTLITSGWSAVSWERFGGGFDALVAATAPIFWGFFLLSGLAVIVLRIREPELPRPFRSPLFPLLPLIFCGTSGYMLYSSITWAEELCLLGAGPLLAGLPLYWLSSKLGTPTPPANAN
ncbi:APC family permease [Thalassoroseus pseudoceratinae]|uniref:APC family permease n=1 Tax=Thalassoroseus pseudoceratinae TaxID=2713176 RepID=UPI00141D74B5|nr:amino acid permease [Thalassoroseus pseudoceratinae]